MATISYRIRKSKSEFSTIYLNLRVPVGKVVELRTTLSVMPNQWSGLKQLAKNTLAENKRLNTNLVRLKKYLNDKLNDSYSGLITSKKIKQWTFECLNRVTVSNIKDIHAFTQQFLELSPELKTNTLKGYENLLVTLKEFEQSTGNAFYLEVTKKMID